MWEQIKQKIWNSKPVTLLIGISKKLVIPGFDGLPLYNVLEFFVKGIQNGSLTTRASSLAFKFFMAIFPSIIFLITLIPYIPIENFQDQLLTLLHDILPHNAFEATRETFED